MEIDSLCRCRTFTKAALFRFHGLLAVGYVLPGLRAFSDAMHAALGARWDEWGTEQVASNYAVANAGAAGSLVPPTYVNHTPEAALEDARLVHFYGTHRFRGGRYLAAARAAVARMGQ